MAKTKTLEQFILEATTRHANKYQYNNVVYTTAYTKILITCPIHGQFSQTPNNHLKGQGCPSCGRDQRIRTNLLRYGTRNPQQNKEVRQKTEKTNLERYGCTNQFGNLEIQNKRNQTMIDRYGVMYSYQSPKLYNKCQQTMSDRYGVIHNSHILAVVQKRIQTMFVKYGVSQYKKSHMIVILPLIQDYNWLFDQYIIQNKTAIQLADELEISDITVGVYLKNAEIEIKQGYWKSYKSDCWLRVVESEEKVSILKEYNIPGTRFRADGYCKETNTIYEFYGDYWHGNPEVYSPDVINEVNGKLMGELYQKTMDREHFIKSLGYNLIVIWEYSVDKDI